VKYKRLDYDWFTGVAFPRWSLSGYFIVWNHAYWRILPSRKMRSNIIFGENALLTLEVNFAEALLALEFLFAMSLRFPSILYILSKSLWERRNFLVSSFYIRCSNSLPSRLGDRAKITPAVRGRIRMRPSSSIVPTRGRRREIWDPHSVKKKRWAGKVVHPSSPTRCCWSSYLQWWIEHAQPQVYGRFRVLLSVISEISHA